MWLRAWLHLCRVPVHPSKHPQGARVSREKPTSWIKECEAAVMSQHIIPRIDSETEGHLPPDQMTVSLVLPPPLRLARPFFIDRSGARTYNFDLICRLRCTICGRHTLSHRDERRLCRTCLKKTFISPCRLIHIILALDVRHCTAPPQFRACHLQVLASTSPDKVAN